MPVSDVAVMLTMWSITDHYSGVHAHAHTHTRARTLARTHTNVKPTQVYIGSAHRIL